MIQKGTNVGFAAKCIREGGLVAFPTETVYGLGADALNPQAVARIFEVKRRPAFDPLIVHISEISQLKMLFDHPVSPLVNKIADAFWPGPITIVHRKSGIVPDLVTSGLNTVAVRMPSHPVALELIRLAQTPIAAPSANRFGQLSPTKPEHVLKQLTGIEYLLTGNDKMAGIESTVISIDGDQCFLLRPGAISLSDIQKVVPCCHLDQSKKGKDLPSPGLLKSHYSPNKPLYILQQDIHSLPQNSGLILHQKTGLPTNASNTIHTSDNGNQIEIAANLFTALHAMEDDPTILQIFIEPVEELGLGIAIMDRIKKAEFRYTGNRE
ncbi:MAG TPA: threonylcarbamoyl-AMP synthase [Prolixibacteraceae bacterium]|nr:threonylcarbamoyl-AMP synthase [Prolixibacteraceae bacterium]